MTSGSHMVPPYQGDPLGSGLGIDRIVNLTKRSTTELTAQAVDVAYLGVGRTRWAEPKQTAANNRLKWMREWSEVACTIMHTRILSFEVDFWFSLFVLTFWSAIFWAEGLNYGRTPGGFKLKGKVWDRPLWALVGLFIPRSTRLAKVKRCQEALPSRCITESCCWPWSMPWQEAANTIWIWHGPENQRWYSQSRHSFFYSKCAITDRIAASWHSSQTPSLENGVWCFAAKL